MRLCVPTLRLFVARASRLAGLRRGVVAGLGIVLLVLQMLAPVPGRAATGGEWIEICSDYGVIEIEVTPNGTTPDGGADCPECPACALCALTSLTALEPATHNVRFDAATLPFVWYPTSVSVPNPAQFWYSNRGPPRAKASTSHTGLRALAPISTKGEVPCS